MNEWKPNTTQQAVIDFLNKNKGQQYTLSEIATNLGMEKLQTGTTNTLVKKGIITMLKDSVEIVCPHCGHKKSVSVYFIK